MARLLLCISKKRRMKPLHKNGGVHHCVHKGTLYIGESQHKHPGERFIMLTDKKDFHLTTGYGKIEMTEKFIKIATKNSSYIFLIE